MSSSPPTALTFAHTGPSACIALSLLREQTPTVLNPAGCLGWSAAPVLPHPGLPSLHELSGDELGVSRGPGLAPRNSNAHVAMGTGFDLHSPFPHVPVGVAVQCGHFRSCLLPEGNMVAPPSLMINDVLGPQGSERGRHGCGEAAWEEEGKVYEKVRRLSGGGSLEGVSP